MSLIIRWWSRQEESFSLKKKESRQKLPFLHFFGKTKDLQSFRVTSRIFMGARRSWLWSISKVWYFSSPSKHIMKALSSLWLHRWKWSKRLRTQHCNLLLKMQHHNRASCYEKKRCIPQETKQFQMKYETTFFLTEFE